MGVYEEKSRNKHPNKEKKKKKSGEIPAFGNWDYENELPITQYFESARQAGLIRFSNVSSAAADLEPKQWPIYTHPQAHPHQLYALHFHHCSSNFNPNAKKLKIPQAKANEYGRQSVKKMNKVDNYLKEQPRESKLTNTNNIRGGAIRVPPGKQKQCIKNAKAVDEDLYKISPQLLHSSKRIMQKKRLGLFSRCLVPDCMV